jgi:hypothetical protein
MFTWEELEKIVQDGRLHLLVRSAEIQESYMLTKKQVLEEFESMEDYVKHRALGLKMIPSPITGKLRHAKEEESKIIRLIPNDFPYDIESDVFHDVIWSNFPMESEQVDELIAEMELKMNRKCIYFVNPPHLQSIPQVFHVHVFSKTN